MAKVLTISKDENLASIAEKLKQWNAALPVNEKAFHAKKFTGKIKSFGNALEFQRKLRDEWD